MKCTDPGHQYEIEGNQTLRFLKKERNGTGAELKTTITGTTNEELIEVLLDRLNHLNSMFPCVENERAIGHLIQAKDWLDLRTSKRQSQGVEGTAQSHQS
jgi:hypothetical protein